MSDMGTTTTGTPGMPGMPGQAGQTGATGVQERAGEVASTAKDQAANVASTAGEQVKAVAADAKQEARRLVDDGRQKLRDEATEQSHRAASSLRELSGQLQKMVSGQGPAEGPAADIARQAADGVQRLAERLDGRSPEELLDDVKRFARQRPGLFLLGAMGAGFAAGRLLRTVDTSSIADAAKSAAGLDGGGAAQGSPELVSGPGSLGGLQSGMGGTAPADLIDPPTATTPTMPTMPGTGPGTSTALGAER